MAQQFLDPLAADYVEHGFVVVPNLVDPETIANLLAETVRIARGHYPCEGIEPAPGEWDDKTVLDSILCIHQPHHVSPVMRQALAHPGIVAVLERIVAAHLPHWDGSVKCMQSMLFVKPPDFPGQAWHQDEIYIPTRDRSLAGAWIALDDATIANGCLGVIPGSHRSGCLHPQRPHDDPDEFDASPESHGFDATDEVPVEVTAGTVVFFNGYLLHRSRRNRSDRYRRVLVNHYMNAWSLLPWSVRGGETPATADRRAIVPVSGCDPYAWKGIEPSPNAVTLRSSRAGDAAREKLSRMNRSGN
ncbi:MAG: phytanoyl-CoA dioxygenase family protein [Armatimonadota bacterium]